MVKGWKKVPILLSLEKVTKGGHSFDYLTTMSLDIMCFLGDYLLGIWPHNLFVMGQMV